MDQELPENLQGRRKLAVCAVTTFKAALEAHVNSGKQSNDAGGSVLYVLQRPRSALISSGEWASAKGGVWPPPHPGH